MVDLIARGRVGRLRKVVSELTLSFGLRSSSTRVLPFDFARKSITKLLIALLLVEDLNKSVRVVPGNLLSGKSEKLLFDGP